jgi:acetolactate synthase I/II/III large subunit
VDQVSHGYKLLLGCVKAMEKVKDTVTEEAPMNTADLLIKCIEHEGTKYIFGIPGEETLDMMNAIKRSSIEFITTRHEQGAAFMADVYGRLTGKAGVCLSTLGPGATNLVTGVADANLDGAPLVAITGQVGTDRMHITSHQYLDLVSMFAPITKRSTPVVRPDTVNEVVRLAFKYAEGEKPGASHIDLPNNIAKMPVEGHPLKKVAPQREFATYASIEKAAMVISKAKNPIILAGNGAVRSHASRALTNFAEELKIPVTNTMMGKGIIPMDSKYSLWTLGIPQKDYINKVFEKADLVIAIGYDIVECAPLKWNCNGNLDIIHIGLETAHINKNYQPLVEVVGDISDSLTQILRRSSRETEPEYALEIREKMRTEYESYADDNSFPMKPQKILHDVRKFMGHSDILISDVGAHKMWIARQYNCYEPNTCIISNGFASMGISIPGAIAAKLVNPDKKVLALCGDGGFMMNMQELETAVRIGTQFVTLIFNDSSYGLIKWKQQEQFHETAYVDFTNPDFKMLAESMHCNGYRIEKAEDLLPTLEDAFQQKAPSIIDCRVDYSENIKLTEYLAKLQNDL